MKRVRNKEVNTYANVEVSIENKGEETLEDWELSFGYTAVIDSIWNADSNQESDDRYTIVSKDYNGVIKSGESISFGFIAKGDGEVPQAPEMVDLQGDFYSETASEEVARTVVFGDRYQVRGSITSSWSGNIIGELRIENISDTVIRGWSISFLWDASIVNIWNGKYIKEDGCYVITPTEYNIVIEPGAGVSICFQAEGKNSALLGFQGEDFFRGEEVVMSDGDVAEGGAEYTPMPKVSSIPVETKMPTGTDMPVETDEPVPTMENSTPAVTTAPVISTAPAISTTPAMAAAPAVTATSVPEESQQPLEDFYVYNNTILDKDIQCRNIFIISGTLNLNGHNITAYGDMSQTGGACRLSKGNMDIRAN